MKRLLRFALALPARLGAASPALDRGRGVLRAVFTDAVPDEIESLGRTLVHAAAVGVAAGVVGLAFLTGVELVQRVCLEWLVGYVPLRAAGERLLAESVQGTFRPWLLVLLPALGGLLTGAVAMLVPEVRGGGGDAALRAFHEEGGVIRRRVIWAKMLASILTLGTGGAGGREGPTMQIGAALGSNVGRLLRVSPQERRILLVAGLAAGVSAVFRTPLGAALLAIEVLYRDDFESEALVPAVLASVVAYSVVITASGESILFAHAPRYPFVPAHLPWYALLALGVCTLAILFLASLRRVERWTKRLGWPAWARPALGGLALGVVATPVIWTVGTRVGIPGQGMGLLGGGYGAAQMAITGSPWLPAGWEGVGLMLLLCGAKLVAASFTIGSGGSAGDFAPSVVLGGLFGGAFGRALQLLIADPRIDPGAFALVGMATFYGGVAHVPLASLVLVCELAGSYDLLVPLMLAEGIAFILLRNRALYRAQRPARPAREAAVPDVLEALPVGAVLIRDRAFVSLAPDSPAGEVRARAREATWQDVFPVLDRSGRIVGMLSSTELRSLEDLAADAAIGERMRAPVMVHADISLRAATKLMLRHGLRELLVCDRDQRLVGFLDETEIVAAYLRLSSHGDPTRSSPGLG